MKRRDIPAQLQEFNVSADKIAQNAFRHVDCVEDTLAKTTVVARGISTDAGPTM